MLDEFEKHLRRGNLSNNTISAYLLTIRMYNQLSGEITKQNLLAFKGYLMETYKPKTVNLRIQAINKYLEFIKKESEIEVYDMAIALDCPNIKRLRNENIPYFENAKVKVEIDHHNKNDMFENVITYAEQERIEQEKLEQSIADELSRQEESRYLENSKNEELSRYEEQSRYIEESAQSEQSYLEELSRIDENIKSEKQKKIITLGVISVTIVIAIVISAVAIRKIRK